MELSTISAFGDELLKIATTEVKYRIPGTKKVRTANVPTKKEVREGYRKVRGPTAAALKGGISGFFLSRVLKGGMPGKMGTRGWSIVGGGVGLGDYLTEGKKEKDKMMGLRTKKAAMMSSSTFTPARQLSQTRAVSRFQDKVIHQGERVRPPTVNNVATPPQPG